MDMLRTTAKLILAMAIASCLGAPALARVQMCGPQVTYYGVSGWTARCRIQLMDMNVAELEKQMELLAQTPGHLKDEHAPIRSEREWFQETRNFLIETLAEIGLLSQPVRTSSSGIESDIEIEDAIQSMKRKAEDLARKSCIEKTLRAIDSQDHTGMRVNL